MGTFKDDLDKELHCRQISLRWWWRRRNDEEKEKLIKNAKFQIENRDWKTLTGSEIEWIWKNQPYHL